MGSETYKSYMMNRIAYFFVWLSRVTHCRGFGIQSPSVYQFVRYVLNEHYPYYAYEELRNRFPRQSFLDRKLCELYFRISNEQQGRCWLVCGTRGEDSLSEVMRVYVKAGCHHTSLYYWNAESQMKLPSPPDIIYMKGTDRCRDYYQQLRPLLTDHSLLLVEDIRSRAGKKFWDELLADKTTGITLDLYYCGIVFFDRNRKKSNYIINF